MNQVQLGLIITLFMKFRVVHEGFIPNKMRKRTNTRFRFVRYDCSVAADAAIFDQERYGIWCMEKIPEVKKLKQMNRRKIKLRNLKRHKHIQCSVQLGCEQRSWVR